MGIIRKYKNIRNLKQSVMNLLNDVESKNSHCRVFSCRRQVAEAFERYIRLFSDLGEPFSEQDIRRMSYVVLDNITHDLLTTGKLHIYSGVLSPIGESALYVFKKMQQYAVEHGELTQEESDETILDLYKTIKLIG